MARACWPSENEAITTGIIALSPLHESHIFKPDPIPPTKPCPIPDVTEVEEALTQGEILEAYPHDPRGESCLMLGYAGIKPIHAVLGWVKVRGTEKRILRIITVYIPQPPKWSDPRTRGGRR